MAAIETQRTIEAVWKIEAPRLIAALTRMTRDVGTAEDLAQDALVAALQQWPAEGIPPNPGGWLMQTAKYRALDRLRHSRMQLRKHQQLGVREQEREAAMPDFDSALEDLSDDVLRLMFLACHPVLAQESRVALTLRLLGGLTTEEIARAFLVSEATVAQRIVRAKRTLAEKRIALENPGAAERHERLESVLSVLYLIFNEGYSASSGDDWLRPALCEDAMRLGRLLAALMPREAEVQGLVALMELQASRAPARVAADGTPVLLLDQNRARWDQLLIRRGLAALERAVALGGARGPYTLQASIAACHARARTAQATDWARIAELYSTLAEVTPSPVIELNRAMAVSMAHGPAAALEIVDALRNDPALRLYPRLPSARADLLFRLGRFVEAEAEFVRAAELTSNTQERAMLLARVVECRRSRGN